MARVPTYEGGGVVNAIDIPRQQGLPAGAFGIGSPDIAGMASKALDAAAGFFEERDKVRDADMVNRAEVAFAQAEQDYRANVSENRIGIDAHGVTKDTEKWVQDQYKSTIDTLENDRQRKAFELRFADRALKLRGDMISHEQKEGKSSYIESKNAQFGMNISDAIKDPSKIDEVRAKNEGIVRDIATLQHLDPDSTNKLLMDKQTMLHSEMIKSLAVNNPEGAKAYFEKYKGEISGDKYDELKKTWEQQDQIIQEQRGAADIAKMNLPFDQQLALARSGKYGEGKVQDGIINRLHVMESERDAIERDHEKKIKDPANQLLAEVRSSGRMIKPQEIDSIVKSVTAQNPKFGADVAAEFMAHNDHVRMQQKQLSALAKQEARDDAAYNSVMLKYQMINNPDKWANAKLIGDTNGPGVLDSLVKDRKITPQDAEEAVRIQQDLRKPQKTPEIQTMVSAHQYMEQKLAGASFPDGKKWEDRKEGERSQLVNNAMMQLEPKLLQFQSQNKEKANDLEVRALIDSSFTDQRFRKTLFPFGMGPSVGDPIVRKNFTPESASVPARKSNAPVRVNTEEEVKRLAPGTVFIGPSGIPKVR